MTPDPAGMAAVDPTNPQSWNRYAYVMNNPLNFIDFVGLECYASDQFGNCTNWGSSDGSNLALLGGFADPFQIYFTPARVLTVVRQLKPISTPLDQMRNENGAAVSALIVIYDTWEQLGTGVHPVDLDAGSSIDWSWVGAYLSTALNPLPELTRPDSCFNQFLGEAFDPADQMANVDGAIKSTAQSGAYAAATSYAAQQGLVVPMRSSVVRGILDFGEFAGEAAALTLTIYEEGKALKNEVENFESGECQ